jgi:hypothetical protein
MQPATNLHRGSRCVRCQQWAAVATQPRQRCRWRPACRAALPGAWPTRLGPCHAGLPGSLTGRQRTLTAHHARAHAGTWRSVAPRRPRRGRQTRQRSGASQLRAPLLMRRCLQHPSPWHLSQALCCAAAAAAARCCQRPPRCRCYRRSPPWRSAESVPKIRRRCRCVAAALSWGAATHPCHHG